MLPPSFRAYVVNKRADGQVEACVEERSPSELPPGEVTIRVLYSSLNYKDALAATGHPGVNKVFPHVPGVDAAGTVVHSGVYEWVPGDAAVVTGFDMGANRWGGWAELVRVPQSWVVPLPTGLSLRESMILGTAGFTAGLCIDALQKHGVMPERGPVVVTGASGGVGSLAVAILAKLGYEVAAVTGKPSVHELLRRLGAREILPRQAVDDRSGKPMLSGRWAGGVDTVGGNILSTILRACRHSGCVAACGLTAGNQLSMTVYPFILRGITLAGVDAAWCALDLRHEIWRRLAGPWKPDGLEHLARFERLDTIQRWIGEILAGQVTGRVVIDVGTGDSPAGPL